MLTIGRVARTLGIRPSAIRYYERHGIVEPAARGASGYRFYSNDAVKLLLFLRRAQALGLRLDEIKPLIDLVSQGRPPCDHVKQVARSHLREVDQKIRELKTLRNQLQSLLRRKASKAHEGEVCPIIERSTA
jgi:MerR family transcriptional regulator, copper efflux regulator